MKIKRLISNKFIKNNTLKDLFRVMRVTLILLFVLSFQLIANNTKGQDAIVTLKNNKVSVRQLINEIEKQTDYLVVYSNREVNTSRTVNLKNKSDKVSEYLNQTFNGTDIGYDFENNYIVLVKRTSQNAATIASMIQEKQQQGNTITGTVVDTNGEPIIGATIVVQGDATKGTITDADGNYRLTNVPENATLNISYVGMQQQSILTTGRTNINVTLAEDMELLDEVVVVGYGTQKKETLTGSVASLKGSIIELSPTTNLTNNLLGRVPGLSAISRSGEPGRDGANLLIRGINTLGNNSPLVVVDGVPNRNFERLNPSDIESITVLKDASAAIYGSQAANGAIIVTTKRGMFGKPTINLNLGMGINQPTQIPKMADAYQYTALLNELEYYKNPAAGWFQRFSEEELQKFKDGSDPWGYPNTDWFRETLKTWSSQHQTSATLSGGTENIQYFISLGEKFQDAYYKKSSSNYSQYNLRSNLNAKINEYIDIAFDISGRLENYNLPTRPTESIIWSMITRGKPNMPAYWPNGDPGPDIERGDNPVVIVSDAPGYDKVDNYVFEGNFRTNIKNPWIEGLVLTANAAYDRTFRLEKIFNKPWYLYTWDGNPDHVTIRGKRGLDSPQLTEGYSGGQNYLLNAFATYIKSVDNIHNFKIMAGTEARSGRGKYFGAFRRNYISDAIEELFAGAEDQYMSNWGASNHNAYLSYFGRINYDYANKYLMEFLWRYDGSYMFPKDKRFGFFPGISLGWRVSEEEFLRNKIYPVNDLKLRMSWGQTGNDRIAEYQYLTTYGFTERNYAFGVPAIDYKLLRETKIPNPDVTWEVANQFNIGFDSYLFDNKLFMILDYFNNLRSQILINRNASVPSTTGFSLPPENIGKVKNNGVEVEVGYRDNFQDLSYAISFNASYSRNKIIFWDETPGIPDYQRSTGRPTGSALYYEAIGIFKDQASLDAYPHLPGARPGDIIYKDVNKDDVIDGLDRVMNTKTDMPRLISGLNFTLSYKKMIDLTMFFQGAAGAQQYISMEESGDWGNYYKFFADDHWTPENINSKYPRAYNRSELYWINTANTFWLRPTDYIRLKNIELGYSFPQRFTQSLGFEAFRLYVNAFNLFTIDNLKYFDPEGTGSGRAYPAQRIVNIGLGLTF